MIIPISLAYLGLALFLADTAWRSWRIPGRVDDPSTLHARPAPAVGRHRVGPPAPSRRLDNDDVQSWLAETESFDSNELRESYRLLADDRVHDMINGRGAWAGATEGWSPLQEAAAVERTALPLDDADEWLAERLRAYEHELSRISACRRGANGERARWDALVEDSNGEYRTLDDELRAFQQGSMALHAYRSMILDSTGGYGPREHMELEALLAA